MSWKYIMLEAEHEGQKVRLPVLFPSNFVHADVYEALRMANRRSAGKMRLPWADPKAVAAGTVEGLRIHAATGESETLGVAADPGDTEIINTFQYMKGLI